MSGRIKVHQGDRTGVTSQTMEPSVEPGDKWGGLGLLLGVESVKLTKLCGLLDVCRGELRTDAQAHS